MNPAPPGAPLNTHTDGNTPIIATLRRINDLDERGNDRIVAEDAKGGWRTKAARAVLALAALWQHRRRQQAGGSI